MRKKFPGMIVVTASLLVSLAVLALPGGAHSAEKGEKGKKPYPQYWMDVSTQNMSIPGMEGMPGGILGKIAGGKGFGPSRTLLLQLNSPRQLPQEPSALHDIPPGQNMGKNLPLIIPEKVKVEKREYAEKEEPRQKVEKPKARMLIYWGCGDEVRKGQPRVLDTEKMSIEQFGKAMGSLSAHAPSPEYPPHERAGWIYADWPNRESHIEVPKDSSLQGDQYVHGNYIPDMKFTIDKMHDFMAPVKFTSITGGAQDSIKFAWRQIPTAVGYLATTMAHNDKAGETIFWSSSEVPDIGFGLMGFLSPGDVRKFLKEKVIMDPGTTECSIPKGIFKDAGGMLQFTAYGDELNVVYPPKPKDPKKFWQPEWAVKVRLKSTGMTTLGQGEETRSSRRVKQRENVEEEQSGDSSEGQEEPPQQPEKKKDESGNPLKKLKGLFGF
ncbi:MAG: hypothetical protein M0Z67_07905 [Nitrospiraceae bacterium]|nr:hypothetical protein [Nitrospiraceae bacterium]